MGMLELSLGFSVKFSGGPGSMSDNIALTNEVLRKHQGEKLTLAKDEAENDEIWAARKGLFFSQQLLVPGCKVYITDACVPLSKLPELVEETAKDIKASGFIAPILGHSGDGNVSQNAFAAPLLTADGLSLLDSVRLRVVVIFCFQR
jgi:D-lactate dehydrogenase (cytochrome)